MAKWSTTASIPANARCAKRLEHLYCSKQIAQRACAQEVLSFYKTRLTTQERHHVSGGTSFHQVPVLPICEVATLPIRKENPRHELRYPSS
jgi:hypothetical protein